MSEKLNNDQSKDDSVAQAWVDAMSTFTERTGLELPDYDSAPESADNNASDDDSWDDGDDWGDVWGDVSWDDNFEDWQGGETQPKTRLDKYKNAWNEDLTPAQIEFERVNRVKLGAERANNNAFRRINSIRARNRQSINQYCSPDRFTPTQIATISQYLEDYATNQPGSEGNYALRGLLETAYQHGEDGQIILDEFAYNRQLDKIKNAPPHAVEDTQASLSRYHDLHGLDHDRLVAFSKNVQPLIFAQDKEVASLTYTTNNWSVFLDDKDRFGLADYTVHCLVQEVNPCNLNELLMIRREFPATSQYRLEQNRIDALELQGTLYRARDFIHDESPGVHELLSAMLDYYDSKDNPELHIEKEKVLRTILDERDRNVKYYNVSSDTLAPYIFNLENYEKPVHPRRLERDTRASFSSGVLDVTEPAIDCLRRLVDNTNPDRLTPPETKYPELNELMQKLRINQNERTGETHVDWRQAGELVEVVNRILIDSQEKRGLYPSTVEAVAFAERIATFALRDITRRDWHELPYDPNFKEIVRFSQLTYSDKPYDARKFERFWNGFSDIPNGDLSDENLQAAYNKLQRLVLNNLTGLANKYSQNPSTAERTKALWSGNLIREFLALADPNVHRK